MEIMDILIWFGGLWGGSVVIGLLIGYYTDRIMSVVSGLMSLAIAVVLTYLVHSVLIQSGDISWALIAVGIASFFSGLFGYISGVESTRPER